MKELRELIARVETILVEAATGLSSRDGDAREQLSQGVADALREIDRGRMRGEIK